MQHSKTGLSYKDTDRKKYNVGINVIHFVLVLKQDRKLDRTKLTWYKFGFVLLFFLSSFSISGNILVSSFRIGKALK